MRTNLPSFALTVGMALLVVLMGFGALSAAGLVGFAAEEARQTEADERNQEEAWAAYQQELAHPTPKPKPMVKGVAASGDELAAIEAGDALFKANCTQCHAVNEKVVGPALTGITKRRSASWIVSWVHNPAKVIASGDAYAMKLFDEHGKQQMPSFPQLSDKEIRGIMAWITSQEGSVSVGTDAATTGASIANSQVDQ